MMQSNSESNATAQAALRTVDQTTKARSEDMEKMAQSIAESNAALHQALQELHQASQQDPAAAELIGDVSNNGVGASFIHRTRAGSRSKASTWQKLEEAADLNKRNGLDTPQKVAHYIFHKPAPIWEVPAPKIPEVDATSVPAPTTEEPVPAPTTAAEEPMVATAKLELQLAFAHWRGRAARSWELVFEDFGVPEAPIKKRREIANNILVTQTSSLNYQQLCWSVTKDESKRAMREQDFNEIDELLADLKVSEADAGDGEPLVESADGEGPKLPQVCTNLATRL